MFGSLPEWIQVLCALLCMGAAVKMLDDALDMQVDLARGKATIAGRLGRSVTAYVVILALCATVFELADSNRSLFGELRCWHVFIRA